MEHWPISRQLRVGLGGLACVILMLTVAAGVGKISIKQLFSGYSSQTELSRLVVAIVEDLNEAQLHGFAFAANGDPADIEAFESNLQEVREQLDLLVARTDLPVDLAPRVDALVSEKAAYDAAFQRVVAANAQMNARQATLSEAGTTTRETLATLLNAANRAGDPGQVYSAARVIESFVLAGGFMERFAVDGAAETFETATGHLDSAAQQLSWMATMPGDPERADLMAQARDGIAAYADIATSLRAASVERTSGLDALDTSNSAILDHSDVLVDRSVADQLAIGDRVDSLLDVIAIALVIVGTLSVGIAIWLAARILRSIRLQFDATLQTVETLAEGNLDIDIPGTGRPTELGRIADALEVFRTRGREAAEMARRNEETEARNRAEARRREEEQREAEAQRARSEQEAAERRKREIFAELERAVSSVVDAAARGDFTGRVDTTGLDAELARLGGAINTLMGNVDQGLAEISRVTERLAAGDLREGMQGDFQGTFHALQENIDAMTVSLGELFRGISTEAAGVRARACDMTSGAEDLARRAESQAASLEQTSASMTEISSAAQSNAGIAATTEADAQTMSEEAGQARGVLDATMTAMKDIEDHSKEIEAIVDVIEEIAFQTNLLSLNASVEAARAGEAGKGFAVVANEVRALAQRSADASSRVQNIINQSTGAISRGSDTVGETGEALGRIVTRVQSVAASVREIKSASEEQATAVRDITNAFGQLDKITQRNATVAEETRSSAMALSAQSERMEQAVGRVRIRADAGDGPPIGRGAPARVAA